jgi:hypothetical protein
MEREDYLPLSAKIRELDRASAMAAELEIRGFVAHFQRH